MRRNCSASFRLPTAPKRQSSRIQQAVRTPTICSPAEPTAEWQAQSYLLAGLPTLPSPGVHLFSRGTAQVLEEEAAGASPSVESSVLERDAAATNGALLEWELRQGTGPRAGAPRHMKTLLLGTFSSKQSPERLVPAATEEWIPPGDRARRCSGPLQVSRTQPSPAQTPH